jgi:hypothetical protein
MLADIYTLETPETEATEPNENPKEDKKAPNSPSVVRASFLTYLRVMFPYTKDWKHPTTGDIFTHALIERRLRQLKKTDPNGYRALWLLWTSQGTRSFIADQLHCSGPTIKRRWDRSIDTLLLMLIFPDLVPEAFSLFSHYE